jgi:DNA-binding response OmpR family regulator
LSHIFPQLRVLLVEDDMLIGLEVKDTLGALGCQVFGPFGTVASAMAAVDANRFDAAVLDINLGRELSFPIADALTLIRVPFLFLTAYNRATLPAAYRDSPLISKPFMPELLVAELAGLAVALDTHPLNKLGSEIEQDAVEIERALIDVAKPPKS